MFDSFRTVSLAEIAEHSHVLTPGRYVCTEEADDDDEVFDEVVRLPSQLAEHMAKGEELDAAIREKLGAMAYGLLRTWFAGPPTTERWLESPAPRCWGSAQFDRAADVEIMASRRMGEMASRSSC